MQWDSAAASGTANTFNVEVTRVRSTAREQQAAGLPPHRYAMILEISNRFAINNNADGDLTKGWEPIPGAVNPPLNGGPSIRWNPLDGLYYTILGGSHVELVRTRDFKTWERSPVRCIQYHNTRQSPARVLYGAYRRMMLVFTERAFHPAQSR